MIKMFAAPLQGHTDAVFRHFHREVYGREDVYYITPFARVEKGDVRERDIREATSVLNANHHLAAQVIFKDAAEFKLLTERLRSVNISNINLNMGCAFVPQCRKGRGAAMPGNTSVLEQVRACMLEMQDTSFSIKMRLGLTSADDWMRSADVINAMPLQFVAVHPRTGADGYVGQVRHEVFEQIRQSIKHPVLYNGDITTSEDISEMLSRHPGIWGIMVGRGLIGRPSLFNEWAEGCDWPREKRLKYMLRLHDCIFHYYEDVLCGEAQVLSKIKPFWEYAEWELGRKTIKAISKAGTMSKYRAAVSAIE